MANKKNEPLEIQYDEEAVKQGRDEWLRQQKEAKRGKKKKRGWRGLLPGGKKKNDAPAAKKGGPLKNDPNRPVEKLVRACRENKMKSAQKWIDQHGADINGKSKKEGHTALYAAVSHEKPNVRFVQSLLRQSADPNCSVYDHDAHMEFPVVFQAAHDGSLSLVEMLVCAGASLNPVKDATGKEKSVLQYAIRSGHIDVVRYLLEANKGNFSQNILDRCLYSAVGKDQPSIVRLLCENGADVNKRTDKASKGTPLLAACRAGYSQVIPVLLEFGADPEKGSDPTTQNPNGVSPMEAAQKRQFDHIINMLNAAKTNKPANAKAKAPEPKKPALPKQPKGYGPAVFAGNDSYYSDYSDYSSYSYSDLPPAKGAKAGPAKKTAASKPAAKKSGKPAPKAASKKAPVKATVPKKPVAPLDEYYSSYD